MFQLKIVLLDLGRTTCCVCIRSVYLIEQSHSPYKQVQEVEASANIATISIRLCVPCQLCFSSPVWPPPLLCSTFTLESTVFILCRVPLSRVILTYTVVRYADCDDGEQSQCSSRRPSKGASPVVSIQLFKRRGWACCISHGVVYLYVSNLPFDRLTIILFKIAYLRYAFSRNETRRVIETGALALGTPLVL